MAVIASALCRTLRLVFGSESRDCTRGAGSDAWLEYHVLYLRLAAMVQDVMNCTNSQIIAQPLVSPVVPWGTQAGFGSVLMLWFARFSEKCQHRAICFSLHSLCEDTLPVF